MDVPVKASQDKPFRGYTAAWAENSQPGSNPLESNRRQSRGELCAIPN
jgi:hypothetical protein